MWDVLLTIIYAILAYLVSHWLGGFFQHSRKNGMWGFVYSVGVFGTIAFFHFAIYYSFLLSIIEVGWMIVVCALGALIGKEHYELRKHRAQ